MFHDWHEQAGAATWNIVPYINGICCRPSWPTVFGNSNPNHEVVLGGFFVAQEPELAFLDTLEIGEPIRAVLQHGERPAALLRHWAWLLEELAEVDSCFKGVEEHFYVPVIFDKPYVIAQRSQATGKG